MADETAIAPEPELLEERIGHIMVLTLNRPKAVNAISPQITQLLDDALNRAEEDDGVFVVVLTAAGDRVFCAGLDLKHLAEHGDADFIAGDNGFAGIAERVFSKPIICAVNGACMGGGTEIALSCDLIVAAENARFALPEVKRGILAAAGGPIRIMKSIPRTAALEMLFTGEPLSAQRAYDLGLVNKVVPLANLREEALALAEQIAANAPLAVQATKLLAYASTTLEIDDAFALSKKLGAKVMASEDAQEGPRAFLEKRAPVWQGK